MHVYACVYVYQCKSFKTYIYKRVHINTYVYIYLYIHVDVCMRI